MSKAERAQNRVGSNPFGEIRQYNDQKPDYIARYVKNTNILISDLPYATQIKAYDTRPGNARRADEQLAVSAHHIIPFRDLQAFGNALIKNRHFNTLTSTSRLIGIPYHVLVGELKRIEEGQSGDLAQIQSFFCWMPGNLMIGPSDRVDDPGSNFDDLRSSFGRPEDRNRIKILKEEVYPKMLNYISMNRQRNGDEAIDVILKYFPNFNIMKFDERIWEPVPTSRKSLGQKVQFQLIGRLDVSG